MTHKRLAATRWLTHTQLECAHARHGDPAAVAVLAVRLKEVLHNPVTVSTDLVYQASAEPRESPLGCRAAPRAIPSVSHGTGSLATSLYLQLLILGLEFNNPKGMQGQWRVLTLLPEGQRKCGGPSPTQGAEWLVIACAHLHSSGR